MKYRSVMVESSMVHEYSSFLLVDVYQESSLRQYLDGHSDEGYFKYYGSFDLLNSFSRFDDVLDYLRNQSPTGSAGITSYVLCLRIPQSEINDAAAFGDFHKNIIAAIDCTSLNLNIPFSKVKITYSSDKREVASVATNSSCQFSRSQKIDDPSRSCEAIKTGNRSPSSDAPIAYFQKSAT